MRREEVNDERWWSCRWDTGESAVNESTEFLFFYKLLFPVRLDVMITVVDAQGFLKDYRSLEGVLDREELVKEMGLAHRPSKARRRRGRKKSSPKS